MKNEHPAPSGASPLPPVIDSRDFIRLLSQHFGDGLVYLADEADRVLLKTAIDDGLISPDGHVTAAGYRLWRRATDD